MATTDVREEIRKIFRTAWTTRVGLKVPDTPDITLGNEGVRLECAVLYADLTDSTGLVDGFKHTFAAEIYKAYLLGACRAIQLRGGEITAFDGDRVMAVFIGSGKNSSAAKAALGINWVVRQTNEILAQEYPKTTYRLSQKVGIDSGELLVARTGIRNSNDLVWVGKPANLAAKLCSIGDAEYPTFITEAVHSKLSSEAKMGGNPARNMWEQRFWPARQTTVYRSNWWWEL